MDVLKGPGFLSCSYHSLGSRVEGARGGIHTTEELALLEISRLQLDSIVPCFVVKGVPQQSNRLLGVGVLLQDPSAKHKHV